MQLTTTDCRIAWLKSQVSIVVQVATEWLFACADDVLNHHLHGTAPNSATVTTAEEPDAVLEPRRVVLQVGWIY